MMKTILAIDWGGRRVGTALTNTVAQLPKPYQRLDNNDSLIEAVSAIVEEEAVDVVVVGLPRNLGGEETPQSAQVREFAAKLEEALQCQVLLQDETLSTQAAGELRAQFPKADIDSLAATVILGDYLKNL